jgi:hypothetical protein
MMKPDGDGDDGDGDGDDDDAAARFLDARGIQASTVNYDSQFDSGEGAAKLVRGFLSSQLGCDDIDGTLMRGLVEVFDKEHADETQFNVELFKEMATCFDASSTWSVEHFPPTEDWSEDSPPRLTVITGRTSGDESTAAPRAPPEKQPAKETAADEDETFPASPGGGIRATRSSSRVKRGAAPVEGGTGRKRTSGENVVPFVASARVHPAADASANAATEKEGEAPSQRPRRERQQQEEGWQYALGLVRGARVPEKEGGVVKRNSQVLDHALVIVSRDANETHRGGGELGGGWGVCQVLATVELALMDSTCQEFARESDRDDASIVIKRSNLTKTGGGAGPPLAREVMHVFGHVAWSRAALGLPLPTTLPLAVVAARKEKAATALPSTRMRWVYGNLDIPEECGGMFSFNVSSCGAFHGTAPESAIAVYMKVLMDGLDQGERWINDMLHRKPPPPSDETGPSPKKPSSLPLLEAQRSPPDTRPWPSSMCGRRLFFGGSPLALFDAKLVATPARMRTLDFPASQGELHRGG